MRGSSSNSASSFEMHFSLPITDGITQLNRSFSRTTFLEHMSDTTPLPSEEQPFALRFHGFVDECPHAVKRFTTFCTTDLQLTDEETDRILAHPGSAVICKRDSLDDLESLADAFEGLGVRVSIADLCDSPPLADLQLPGELAEVSSHLEELLEARTLRMIQSASAPGEYALSLQRHSRIRNTSGATLSRTAVPNGDREQHGPSMTQDYPLHHHGSISLPFAPGMRHRRSRSIRLRTYGRRQTGLTGIQMIGMLIVGLACLIGINRAFIGKPQLSSPSPNSTFGVSWGLRAPEERDAVTSGAGSRHYEGTVSRSGHVLTISARMHEESLSARVLVVTPLDKQGAPEQTASAPQLRRAESDTILLHSSEPGLWEGRLVTYLFIEHDGEISRIPAQTDITLRMNPDQSTADALVVLNAVIPGTLEDLAAVRGITSRTSDAGLSLSLSERARLRATNVSF